MPETSFRVTCPTLDIPDLSDLVELHPQASFEGVQMAGPDEIGQHGLNQGLAAMLRAQLAVNQILGAEGRNYDESRSGKLKGQYFWPNLEDHLQMNGVSINSETGDATVGFLQRDSDREAWQLAHGVQLDGGNQVKFLGERFDINRRGSLRLGYVRGEDGLWHLGQSLKFDDQETHTGLHGGFDHLPGKVLMGSQVYTPGGIVLSSGRWFQTPRHV